MINNSQHHHVAVQIKQKKQAWFSITSFAIMILSFFFTFCVFTCGGEQISEKKYTGIELITIRLSETNEDFGITDIITGLAFISAATGLVLSIISKNKPLIIAVSLAGVFFLMLLYIYIKYQIKQLSAEMTAWIDVKFKFGYFLSIISGLTAAIWNIRKHLESKKPPTNGGF